MSENNSIKNNTTEMNYVYNISYVMLKPQLTRPSN